MEKVKPGINQGKKRHQIEIHMMNGIVFKPKSTKKQKKKNT